MSAVRKEKEKNKMKNISEYFARKEKEKKDKAVFYGLLAMIVVLAIGMIK